MSPRFTVPARIAKALQVIIHPTRFLAPALAMSLLVAAPSSSEVPRSGSPSPAGAPTLTEAGELLMQGSYDAAAEAFEKLAVEPQDAIPAGIGLARCRMQVGKYDEALTALEALKAESSFEWRRLLAELYLRGGRYAEAEQQLVEAIKVDTGYAGARLLLGQLQEYLGRREEAVETYRWFDRQVVERGELPKDAGWMTDSALGFYRFSVLTGTEIGRRTEHVLNEMLQPAYTRLDRGYWPARIVAGDLLREKFNNDEKDGSVSDYQAALRINPHLPEAHVGLGEVALEDWGFEEVEKRVNEALQINPNFAPALHLLAKKLLLERRYEQSREASQRALSINPHDLKALSLAAAAAACRYDQQMVEQMKARVEAINPRCALFHRTLADALSAIRQFESSEREYLRAIELDPTDANARTELGMMYMQWGPEDKARDALDAAWALDTYNERTKFTLELLDRLHRFARHETEHFIIKYDSAQDPGLGEYAGTILEPIYEAVTGDFGTELPFKTIIEIFPTQRAFGVRITGKPWIHTVGACTGHVIALSSPRESTELMGPYHLGRVLKHEFTHTVTLAATENRIPHWFTEGLAVYEEDAPRHFMWCELLADALRRDRLFTLESIDWGFMRPRKPSDRQMAYAQSEWMIEYIVERFGYDSIAAMIRQFRAARTQPQVFEDIFHLKIEEFDRQFGEWARAEIPRWACHFDLSKPDDRGELRLLAEKEDVSADALGRLARAELDEADYERAMNAARRALALDPDDRHALEALTAVLMELARKADLESRRRSVEDEALPLLERLVRLDPDSRTGHSRLGQLLLRRKEWDLAVESFKRLQRLCPIDPASWGALAGVYLERGDEDAALVQLTEIGRMDHGDATVPKKVGMILWKRGETRDACYWFRQALAMDPSSEEVHQALGDVSNQIGDTQTALREYEMLTKLDPKKAKYFEWAALAAQKLGDTARTKELARQAVRLDPNSAVRSLAEE